MVAESTIAGDEKVVPKSLYASLCQTALKSTLYKLCVRIAVDLSLNANIIQRNQIETTAGCDVDEEVYLAY